MGLSSVLLAMGDCRGIGASVMAVCLELTRLLIIFIH